MPNKPLETATFGGVVSKQFSAKSQHDPCLTHTGKFHKNRGVAQLVAREVWDFDAAGSNPVTPTKSPRSSAPGGLFITNFDTSLAGVKL